MAVHTKYALRRSSISKVLNFPLAVPALETICAECLITSKDGKVFDLVRTAAAAVGAIVAYQGAIAKEE